MLYLEDNNLRNFERKDELYELKTSSRSYPSTEILLEKVCMERDGADMLPAKKWNISIHSTFENQSRCDEMSKKGASIIHKNVPEIIGSRNS